ncbi:GDP-mannose mannosyl hydrolase [Halobium palmae]|uniref:GDP-mannose mannosyl hydrolase n=1 Tax=Halobium palmae TaxID=1776492 RepID=A0ABD5S2D0_9EURY
MDARVPRVVTDDDTATPDPPEKPVPDDDWRRIVEHVPLVSVDLLVRDGDGVVVGKRTNEPAKGEWFVPGGTVLKGERLEAAVHRVAREELGVDVEIEERLGTYEHFYDTSEVPGVDSKHYLATAFVVTPAEDESGRRPWEEAATRDDQHAGFRTVVGDDAELHPYVRRYLRDAGIGNAEAGERRDA